MRRRKTSAKSGLPGLLQRLSPEEAAAVLGHLMEKHPELRSDGALGWAPDFPGEHADCVVGAFLTACPREKRKEARKGLADVLAKCAPEWAEDLLRAADQAAKE